MNSIILIAACVVCLDLFFRGRLASYVVDSLKCPKKSRTGHKAEPHTPKAVPAPRRSPNILVSKSYRCGLERTGADMRSTSAVGEAIFAPASKPAMQGWGAPDRRRRRTCGARSSRRHPISASGSPRQCRTPRCGGSCAARGAGLRRECRHGRRHGRGAAGPRQLRHPGLCLKMNERL